MPDFATLPDGELLALLRTEEDRLPEAAARDIVRRIDRLEPGLIAILRDEALWEDDDRAWWALVHAVRLLAAAERPGAFDAVFEAVRRAVEDDLDWIWMSADALLASFGQRGGERLARLFESDEHDDLLRSCILDSLALLAERGAFEADRLLALAADALRHESDDVHVEESASLILSHQLVRHGEEAIRRALGDDLKAVKKRFAAIWDSADELSELSEPASQPPDLWSFYAEAAIRQRQEEWAHEAAEAADDENPFDDASEENPFDEGNDENPWNQWDTVNEEPVGLPPPPLRSGPKPGRNAPCPCGSGKKFKKCCSGKSGP